jgi:hypothetical protein
MPRHGPETAVRAAWLTSSSTWRAHSLIQARLKAAFHGSARVRRRARGSAPDLVALNPAGADRADDGRGGCKSWCIG